MYAALAVLLITSVIILGRLFKRQNAHTILPSGLSRSGKTELFYQVEDLTCKSRVQDIELKRTTHELKEALKVAGEETAKCKAAIKSLTAQLKELDERLPIGARISDTRPLGSSSPTHEVSTAATEKASSPLTYHEPQSIASNTLVVSTAPRVLSNHASNPTEEANSEEIARHKNRGTKAETTHGNELVLQDEPGVYITLVSLPTGVKDLKRIRFSRNRFCEKQAEQWWATNRARLYQQYNVPVVE